MRGWGPWSSSSFLPFFLWIATPDNNRLSLSLSPFPFCPSSSLFLHFISYLLPPSLSLSHTHSTVSNISCVFTCCNAAFETFKIEFMNEFVHKCYRFYRHLRVKRDSRSIFDVSTSPLLNAKFIRKLYSCKKASILQLQMVQLCFINTQGSLDAEFRVLDFMNFELILTNILSIFVVRLMGLRRLFSRRGENFRGAGGQNILFA